MCFVPTIRSPGRRRLGTAAWLLGLLLALGQLRAQSVVDINFTPLFNNDAIINNADPASVGNDPTQGGIDSFGSLITITAMNAINPSQAPGNLPDDGFFPANADHPAIQLAYRDSDDGDNTLKIGGATSFTLLGGTHFPLGQYQRFDLLATSGLGDSLLTFTLAYTTGPTTTFTGATIDDWFDDGPTLATQPAGVTRYYLIDGLDRVGSTSFNDPAIFGLTMAVDASRELASITVAKTNSGPQLNVFGGALQVPEPSALVFLLGGALLVTRRRR